MSTVAFAGTRVEGADQARPVALGSVQGLVGLTQEHIATRGERGRGSHAARECEAPGKDTRRPGLEAGGEQAVGHHLRVDRVAVGEEDGEIVAPDPEQPVGRSELQAEDAAHLGQQVVTDGVAGGVVDGLEVVDVEEEQGEVRPMADAEGEQRSNSSWKARWLARPVRVSSRRDSEPTRRGSQVPCATSRATRRAASPGGPSKATREIASTTAKGSATLTASGPERTNSPEQRPDAAAPRARPAAAGK